MLVKLGDTGCTVKRLQELLDIEPDGHFGPKTRQAVMELQKEYGLQVDGVAGVSFWAALIGPEYPEQRIGTIIDLRGVKPRLYGRPRTWSNIEGVTLHQTGCHMPSNPYRWVNVNYHYAISKKGVIIYLNNETDMIWHAQGLSQKTIGVAFEGNFPGISGNMKTVWAGGGPASQLSCAQKKAAFILQDHLEIQFFTYKREWLRIYAHRQASTSRQSDPGSDIWENVALPWKRNLHLGDFFDGGPGYKLDTGLEIPKEWDPSRKGRY